MKPFDHTRCCGSPTGRPTPLPPEPRLIVVESYNEEHGRCACGVKKGHLTPCGYTPCAPCSERIGYSYSHGYAPHPASLTGWTPPATVRPEPVRYTRINPNGLLKQIQKTMSEKPACLTCGWCFSAAVTYCPTCGSRRP